MKPLGYLALCELARQATVATSCFRHCSNRRSNQPRFSLKTLKESPSLPKQRRVLIPCRRRKAQFATNEQTRITVQSRFVEIERIDGPERKKASKADYKLLLKMMVSCLRSKHISQLDKKCLEVVECILVTKVRKRLPEIYSSKQQV